LLATQSQAQTQVIPGLGEVKVYRLFPGDTTQVTPGSVPNQPNLMTLPGDVETPGTIPSPSAIPSSDGLTRGVRFEAAPPSIASAVLRAMGAPASPASSPTQPLVPSNIPAGMIAPAIDSSLHISNNNNHNNAGSDLIHPAISTIPFQSGLVQASYSDPGALLLSQKEQTFPGATPSAPIIITSADAMPPALLEYIRGLPPPNTAAVTPPKPMAPNEMLQLEFDLLRKQMQK